MMKEERLKQIEKMLEKNKHDSFLNYAAALEYHKTGNLKRAINLLEKLVKRDPNYLGSYHMLGKYYEEANQFKKAIAIYKTGLSIAKSQNDLKTFGELSESLMLIDEDFDGSL